MRTLIFDPFAGISGDMTLAALLDLGLDEQWLRGLVNGLELGDVGIEIQRVQRRGIAAPHVRFRYPPERVHRHLRHVVALIDQAHAPERAKALARDAFERIAAAEAHIHGTTIEKVHFHEVGATDAILDVVCVMSAVCELGFDDFRTRPVAVGSGWIDIEHGRYPVPAPATLRILEGITLTGTDLAGECTTPTGAAILATLTRCRREPRQFAPARTGFGAGTRDPADRPNVLRLVETIGDEAADETLWLLQADLDDMPAEYVAATHAAVLDAGAVDAVILHTTMKKGRPGLRLEALCPDAARTAVEHALFHGSSTIGVRYWPVQRATLHREMEEREWRGQSIRYKKVRLPDGSWRAKPEYDDVARAARALDLPVWQVRSELDH
jgi:pyridinium-3,5-bisthiocarboxylic acid mononucleotide nickel chelatase